MKTLITVWSLVLATSAFAQAVDPAIDAAVQSSAGAIKEKYGTDDKLNQEAFRPLSTNQSMSTVDNATSFGAKIACKESDEFLRVVMLPTGAQDIGSLQLSFDSDLDGTQDVTETINGPFAGVCINGMVQCDAGTFNNCKLLQWQATPTNVSLVPSTTHDVGSCYCFNGSCGANLLWANNQKILGDVATGIARAMNATQPRLILAHASFIDPVTVGYFGQLSACGADHSPESYFSHPADLPAAGASAATEPGSPAQIMSTSIVAGQHDISEGHCTIDRVEDYEVVTKDDILTMIGGTGSESDCGPGCLHFYIGDPTWIYRGGGGSRCRIDDQYVQFGVGRPDLIDSVTLLQTGYDDMARLYLDGTIAWNGMPGWNFPGIPAFRCDWRDHLDSPNTDLVSYFGTAGTVTAMFDIAHDQWGSGWISVEAHVRDGCHLTGEHIESSCAVYETNPDCSLMTETTDGVATVTNYLTTGLSPLGADKPVGPAACALNSGVKPWWHVDRLYTCKTGHPTYDLSDARKRADTIQGSYDFGTGGFTDLVTNPDGTTSTVNQNMAVPTAPYAERKCAPTCKTRKPRPGMEVPNGQPVADINASGLAWDFSFKECDASHTCPLDAGEEVVSACDCRSNFMEAAAMMQTVRMVQKDTQCDAPK